MANLGQKFPPEVLTREEVTAILESCPPTKIGVRNRALVALYLYSQLRCNEALDLRPSDIRWNPGAVTVMNGKGGKRRIAGIPSEILEKYVRPWVNIRPHSEYLFCTLRGKRIDDSYVRRALKRQAEKAGLTHRVHVHGLRHTGAFHLAGAGVDLRYIQRQLGHTSLAVTERYISHLNPTEVVETVNTVIW